MRVHFAIDIIACAIICNNRYTMICISIKQILCCLRNYAYLRLCWLIFIQLAYISIIIVIDALRVTSLREASLDVVYTHDSLNGASLLLKSALCTTFFCSVWSFSFSRKLTPAPAALALRLLASSPTAEWWASADVNPSTP